MIEAYKLHEELGELQKRRAEELAAAAAALESLTSDCWLRSSASRIAKSSKALVELGDDAVTKAKLAEWARDMSEQRYQGIKNACAGESDAELRSMIEAFQRVVDLIYLVLAAT